jgi:UDP-3-O-[3-hydroxymyristoyl] glucosamine N-acyltransferase
LKTSESGYRLGEIAEVLGARLVGDAQRTIMGIQTLNRSAEHQISFLSNPRYRSDLARTRAGAVLLTEAMLTDCPTDALVVIDPYLAYARLSQLFADCSPIKAGIAPSAVIHGDARIDATASIGPHAVIQTGVCIGPGVVIGPQSVIGENCSIGADSRLEAHVTLYHGVHLGARVLVHSGAVLGGDGFGFANDRGRWVKIAQLGGVRVGDDVEIGAGTTIDRGALEDTCIADGVKLDNQIQVAHNVTIGEDTAIAGCTAIAGSTKIGSRCTIAGGVGITGHLDIADGVHVTAMSLVSKSLREAGAYSSGTGISPNRQWRRNVVRFGQLDKLAKRLDLLERNLQKHLKVDD